MPCAFITGITGQFFRQFALTIAVSTVISAFNSLTLSPALAALLLEPAREGQAARPLPRLAYPAGAAGSAGRICALLGPSSSASALPGVLAAARSWVGAAPAALRWSASSAGWIVGRC